MLTRRYSTSYSKEQINRNLIESNWIECPNCVMFTVLGVMTCLSCNFQTSDYRNKSSKPLCENHMKDSTKTPSMSIYIYHDSLEKNNPLYLHKQKMNDLSGDLY